MPCCGAMKAAYEHEGFTVLPGVLGAGQAANFAQKLITHVSQYGSRYAYKMNGAKRGGWYLAEAFCRRPVEGSVERGRVVVRNVREA